MDDAAKLEAETVGFLEVFLDDFLHVARGDGVQVEDVGDGNTNRFGLIVAQVVGPLRIKKPGQPKLTGPNEFVLRAPDVKRPAETGTGSRSLPSDPSTE